MVRVCRGCLVVVRCLGLAARVFAGSLLGVGSAALRDWVGAVPDVGGALGDVLMGSAIGLYKSGLVGLGSFRWWVGCVEVGRGAAVWVRWFSGGALLVRLLSARRVRVAVSFRSGGRSSGRLVQQVLPVGLGWFIQGFVGASSRSLAAVGRRHC